jgi:hypothetical protein
VLLGVWMFLVVILCIGRFKSGVRFWVSAAAALLAFGDGAYVSCECQLPVLSRSYSCLHVKHTRLLYLVSFYGNPFLTFGFGSM